MRNPRYWWASGNIINRNHVMGGMEEPETLEETIESGPPCITDLFQNKISL